MVVSNPETARTVLRQMIAEKVEARWRELAKSGVEDSLAGHSATFADAVMELFPEVEQEARMSGSELWWPVIIGASDEVRFVLRTAPEPIRATKEN